MRERCGVVMPVTNSFENISNASAGSPIRARPELVNATLSAVYILKDQLKMIYRKTTRLAVKRALNQWCRMAEKIDHPMVKKYIGRLRFFEVGTPLTNVHFCNVFKGAAYGTGVEGTESRMVHLPGLK